MAITLVQSARSQTNASTTVTTYGSATTAGNLLIAFGYTNTATASLTITGWTKAVDTTYSTSAQSVGIFYKIADGTETTVTLNGNSICRQHISEWSGLSNPAVTDGSNSNAVSAVMSINTNSITTTVADTLLVCIGGISTSGAGTRSWDSSFSVMLDDASAPRLLSGYRIVSSTGTYSTTGTLHTSNTNSGAAILALTAASAPSANNGAGFFGLM